MRYAVISDVHANESALRRVLEDAAREGADRVACLGDIVGYGPLPAEAVALVRRSAAIVVAGNHDDAVSGRMDAGDFIDLAGEAVARHHAVLSRDDLRWLASLPYTCELDGGAVAAHGGLSDPGAFPYVDSESAAAENFAACGAQLMFVGHTHVPCVHLTGRSGKVYALEPQDFVMEDGKRYIVNPGSVGYPRERNGECMSSYVLYDSAERSVRFRFLPFSVSSVMQRGRGALRRRIAVFAALGALAAAVAGFAVSRAVSTRSQVEVVASKTIPLAPGENRVQANLKLADGEADLRVVFRSKSGAELDARVLRVKRSSAKPLEVPPGSAAAEFSVCRPASGAAVKVQSFNPSVRR